MYSLLEKTVILKEIELFERIPGGEVAKVARIAREEQVEEGEVLFKEGEEGDSMYIILDGKIRIHRDERTIAVLAKGDFLGEMAILDREPRSASATAETEATLLVIEQEVFYEIMASRMEILQGIIRMLTHRLRGVLGRG